MSNAPLHVSWASGGLHVVPAGTHPVPASQRVWKVAAQSVVVSWKPEQYVNTVPLHVATVPLTSHDAPVPRQPVPL